MFKFKKTVTFFVYQKTLTKDTNFKSPCEIYELVSNWTFYKEQDQFKMATARRTLAYFTCTFKKYNFWEQTKKAEIWQFGRLKVY